MWPDQSIDFVKLPEDDLGIHYGLFCDATLKSVISLFIDGKSAQFRKFATETGDQGKGYGSKILQHTLNQAVDRGINRLWCNARVDKTGLYEKFGMHTTAQKFEKSGQQYVIMERML